MTAMKYQFQSITPFYHLLYSGILSLLFLTTFYLLLTDIPLLSCLPHLAVTLCSSLLWVVVNSLRRGLPAPQVFVLQQQLGEGALIYQEVAL